MVFGDGIVQSRKTFEKLAASIFRISMFGVMVTIYHDMWCYNPQYHSLNFQLREDLSSHYD
jgi:hypothetical protein